MHFVYNFETQYFAELLLSIGTKITDNKKCSILGTPLKV